MLLSHHSMVIYIPFAWNLIISHPSFLHFSLSCREKFSLHQSPKYQNIVFPDIMSSVFVSFPFISHIFVYLIFLSSHAINNITMIKSEVKNTMKWTNILRQFCKSRKYKFWLIGKSSIDFISVLSTFVLFKMRLFYQLS